ncbi:MAG: trypsin-like peptidase domain-containing protein, partial [Leptothrix sp. (in: b-proteobacteria)]
MAALLLAATAAAVCGDAVAAREAQPRTVTPRGALQPEEQAVVTLFEQSAPSVAYITTETVERSLFGAEVGRGAGSGFVWDASGHVVTNYHVVEGASRVFVQLDSGQPIEAEAVGVAPEY